MSPMLLSVCRREAVQEGSPISDWRQRLPEAAPLIRSSSHRSNVMRDGLDACPGFSSMQYITAQLADLQSLVSFARSSDSTEADLQRDGY